MHFVKWNKGNLKRKTGIRGLPKHAFLIICEGEQTEPNYFDSFPLPSVFVRAHGVGKDPQSVVRYAIEFRNQEARDDKKYDQVWCVFDRDCWPAQNFNNAIDLAKKKKIKVAYSNQAFELWYFLHFHYLDTAITRQEYIRKLKQQPELDGEYRKNDRTMYSKLKARKENAIRNAERLLSNYSPPNPVQDDPSTTVYLLVEELNKFLNN